MIVHLLLHRERDEYNTSCQTDELCPETDDKEDNERVTWPS